MKKRNVNAENHLLTGGLITGFLTFMGCLPGAAAGAAVTGALVSKDIQKAKKEEAFQRDFAEHQKVLTAARKDWWEVSRLLDDLIDYNFDPNSEQYITQVKLEKLFEGAVLIQQGHDINYKKLEKEEIMEMATRPEYTNKTIVLAGNTPIEYLIATEDGYVGCYRWGHVPYQFRKQIQQLGVTFKPYKFEELEEVKKRVSMKMAESHQFNFNKYI